MREIKFKAKRLDNGEWIIGSFVVMKIPALSKTTIGIVAEGGATLHEVDPSTVCQFTGLKDSEGNEIWEGDTLEGVSNCEVIFEKGTFAARSFDDIFNKGIMELATPLHYLKREDGMIECKVIGNKFDKEK